MASRLVALFALCFIEAAWAEPTASFPFNAQLPPAARINQLFSYSFSPNTFRSDSNMTYSLREHPSWLSIESENRRLYGTPKDEDIPPGDVVGQQFSLIATDSSGSTSMNATIVISRNQPPSVHIPVSQQMDSLGEFSAPASVLSYPSTDFHYTFDPDTFGDGGNLNFYASSNDSTPLPAWIKFDGSTLTFSGKTPAFESLIQPPQKFDFSLIASDIVGFSGTSLSFAIVVGSHKLATDHPVIRLNATRGTKISYDALGKDIQLDNRPVQTSSLNASVENMPSWLTFDRETLLLEGTPKGDDHSTNFTVSFHDSFADTLNVLVQVDVATALFQPTLENIRIQPGDDFNLDLSTYFRDPKDVDIQVGVDPEEGWLKVEGFKVSGKVPKTAKGNLNLSIKATSKSTGLAETEVLHASFLSPDKATDTASSSSGSHTSKSTDPSSMKSEDSDSHHLDTTDILLATILPILFITFIVMLIVCITRRRRHRRTYISASKHRAKISDPIRFAMRNGESDAETTVHHAEKPIVSRKIRVPFFKRGNGAFAELASQNSSSQGSSGSRTPDTISSGSTRRAPLLDLMATGARPATLRSVSPLGDTEDQASWFTVERNAASGRSHKSSDSAQSETTLPEVAQPYLPTSGFLSEAGESAFRSGLDLTLPSLDDLANIQPMPLARKNSDQRSSSSEFSATTSSSAALPAAVLACVQEPFDPSLVSRAQQAAKEPLSETQAEGEAEESIAELKHPARARLSSHQWFSRHSRMDAADSINGAKSFRTEPSFGSNENWRVFHQRDPSIAYLELVGETPFPPSRQGSKSNLEQPEERHSLELMSPSKWGEDERKSTIRPMRSTGAISMLSDDGASVFGEREAVAKAKAKAAEWRREDSAKASERSFSVFI